MIGFKAGTIYLGKNVPMTGEKPLDLASNMNSFYVYCDLLQPILVGVFGVYGVVGVVGVESAASSHRGQDRKKGRYGLSHDESHTVCTPTEKMFRYDTD